MRKIILRTFPSILYQTDAGSTEEEDKGEAWVGRELGSLASQRGVIYDLLALGFSSPTYELVERIREGWFVLPLQESPFLLLGSSPGVYGLEGFSLEATKKTPAEIYIDLQTEHTHLFFGPTAMIVPPYESVYREAGYTVMGETTLSVLKAYEKAGMILSPELGDLPDHVVVELEFLAHLCEEEAALWQGEETHVIKVIQVEREFLTKHLLQWVPIFAKKVVEESSSAFYRNLAEVTKVYLQCEDDHLRTLVDLLEGRNKLEAERPLRGDKL